MWCLMSVEILGMRERNTICLPRKNPETLSFSHAARKEDRQDLSSVEATVILKG